MGKGEIKDDAFSGYYEEEVFSKGLSRENTIEKQVGIATYFYSKGLWDEFEYSVKAMLPLLPEQIRERITLPEHNTTLKGVEAYFNSFIKMQSELENNTNMIFKKKFVKTYE